MTRLAQFAWTAGVAAAVSFVVTGVAIAVTRRLGALDVPTDRSSHDRPKPRTGGVGLLGGLAAAAMGSAHVIGVMPFALAGLAFFVVGFVDDLRVRRGGLPAWTKLGLQAAAAAFAAGLGVRFRGEPIGPWGPLDFGVLSPAMTVLWFVAVVNVINFMDGIDGITAATACVILAASAVVSSPPSTDVCVAGLGAVVGFAVWNAPPSRIILGDGGSHLAGFLVAASACVPAETWVDWDAGYQLREWHAAPWALIGAALVPSIVDVAEGLVHKMRHGIPMSRPHNDHLYQRLVKAGQGHGTSALRYGALAAAGVVLAGPVASRLGLVPAIAGGAAVLALHLWTGARTTRGVPRPEGP